MPKINSISPDDSAFTQILSNIAKPPKRLWYSGKFPDRSRPSITIVGTRKPTAYGKEITYNLSYELAKRGVVIISGLALGIDSIAHQAALDAGGTTIAVLPSNLEQIYPRHHEKLAARIVDSGGALISEYEASQSTQRWNFIERNRIAAGLSDGLLITEAAARSGTSTTASFALEQGKTVMVVPGNITSPMSEGCNALLKVGATPITCLEDILQEFSFQPTQTELPLAANAEQHAIIKLLAEGVRDGDLLHEKSSLSAATFSQTMSLLEIEGKIRPLGANQWSLRG